MDPLADPVAWPPPPPAFPTPEPETFPMPQPFPFPADNNYVRAPIRPPPYPEMIIMAITGLKEREGSSRQAIDKYMQTVFTNLPPNHAALLTWHLKKMKADGALAMVKHSYALPGTVPISAPASENPSLDASTEPKRRPGRPPKTKTPAQTDTTVVPFMESEDAQPNAETMLMSLGLVDDLPQATDSPAPLKRGRGRPPRTNYTGLVSTGPVVKKKGRGRPPGATKAVTFSAPAGPIGTGRRGRPPKAGGMPRGRPRKVVVVGAGGAGLAVKRRGRPPRAGGPVKKPRRLSGKPLGRPKKNGFVPANQVTVQNLAAYQDLKSKLEYMQSRVKQAVDLVRPYFTSDNAPYVYGALQELEELANMDMTTPPQGPPQPPPVTQS